MFAIRWGEQWANQMDGIKFFSIKGCHLSLKSLADLFLIAMYRSINKKKSKVRVLQPNYIYALKILRLEVLSLAPVDICKVE